MNIDPCIEKVLISSQELNEAIKKAADFINKKYANCNRPLILVGILKGCISFIANLLPLIKIDVELDFIAAKSYHDKMESSGSLQIVADLKNDIKDCDVLLVEDIVDTANTIHSLYEILEARNPKSLKLMALLDKPKMRKYDVKVDYVCFTIPPVFVVGYGLDFQELYRNLPYIGVLKPEAYAHLNLESKE